MKTGHWLSAALLALAALTVPPATMKTPPKPPSPIVLKALGEPTVRILNAATRVETFRVGNDGTKPGKGPAEIDKLPVAEVGREQGPGFAARLRNVLLDPRMYPDDADRCLFMPGFAFRLWAGGESVDVVLCFHCDDALIVTHDAMGKAVHTLFTNFGPLRPRMQALTQGLFAADVFPHRRPPPPRKGGAPPPKPPRGLGPRRDGNTTIGTAASERLSRCQGETGDVTR